MSLALRPYLLTHLSDPLWGRLAGRRIFITGGSGLLGTWLMTSLAEANERLNLGIQVWVLSRYPRPTSAQMSEPAVVWLQGEVQTFDAASLPRIDFVIHMASTTAAETYAGASPLGKIDTLYGGARNVCRLAARWGARVLMTSSGAVYGDSMPVHVKELQALCLKTERVDHAWGIGKAVAENILFQHVACGAIEGVVSRCFSVLGPGMPLDLHYAVGNFVSDIQSNRSIRVRGDGRPLRSYLFLADVVIWHLKMLLDGRSGDIYNTGSDQPISVLDLAHRLARLAGIMTPVEVLGAADASVGVPVMNAYVPCIDKARGELTLDIYTPLDSALTAMLTFGRSKDEVKCHDQ